ncbi:MAG: hypothetical protein IJW75_05565, partial [Alphaproteobacteria bacterium]|nr:hypothetical protein [Alphaproteobacteria bacterium]
MVKNCQITREGADLNQCPAVIEQTVIVEPCEQCQGCKQCEEKEVEPCPVCAECTQCESKIIEDSGVLVAHSVTEAPKSI